MAAEAPRRVSLVEEIYENLRQILQSGIRPAQLSRHESLLRRIPVLGEPRPDDRYVRALALDVLLRTAIDRLGNGPEGNATRLLFGVDPGSRGRPLKNRRRLAAEEFDILPSTFRRNYETDIVKDLALEVFDLLRNVRPA